MLGLELGLGIASVSFYGHCNSWCIRVRFKVRVRIMGSVSVRFRVKTRVTARDSVRVKVRVRAMDRYGSGQA